MTLVEFEERCIRDGCEGYVRGKESVCVEGFEQFPDEATIYRCTACDHEYLAVFVLRHSEDCSDSETGRALPE